MPQGQVVDAIGKDIPSDMEQGADVELAHPVAVDGLPAFGVQMPHGDDGHGPFQQGLFLPGRVIDHPVMGPDPLDDLPLLVLDALPGLGGADVPVPEIGNGANDQPGLVIRSFDYDDLIIGRCGGAPDDMDVEEFEEFPGGVQKGRRIVISRRHHHMAVRRGGHAAQETVIELLGTVAGGAAVEHVSCHQERVDLLALDERRQPVQKGFVFVISLAAIKGTAQVPVGGVEDLHVLQLSAGVATFDVCVQVFSLRIAIHHCFVLFD